MKKLTQKRFEKIWFVATEREDVGSKFYMKHIKQLEDMKDFTSWFFKKHLGLSEMDFFVLELHDLFHAMRIAVSPCTVLVIANIKEIEKLKECVNNVLESGDAVDFEYAYENYLLFRKAKKEAIREAKRGTQGIKETLSNHIAIKMNKVNIADTFKLKDLMAGALIDPDNNVENIGDIVISECDLIVGDVQLMDFSFIDINILNETTVLEKWRNLIIKNYAYGVDEIGNNKDLIELSCHSQAHNKLHHIARNLTIDELDTLTSIIHQHHLNNPWDALPEHLVLGFSAEAVKHNTSAITILEPFRAYSNRTKGYKPIGLTIVPPFYWLQEIKTLKKQIEG